MDIDRNMRWDRPLDLKVLGSEIAMDESSSAPKSTDALTNILRFVHSEAEPGASAHLSSPQDWTNLIERVRAAAHHTRAVEAQAQEQEQRVQELLERVREDIKLASEKVRSAEAKAANVQAHAELRIRAAEERAAAAEERARIAEAWLKQVHEAVTSEFATLPGMKGKAA